MKHRYFFIPLFVLILAFINESCTTTMYTSNTLNTPLLTKKKEVQVSLTQSDVQAAVAVGDHIGIMANGFFKSYNGDNNYEHRGGLLEAGVGYYDPFKEHVVFEAYAGAGIGRVYKQEMFTAANNSEYLASFTGNASRIFIQPNIGFTSGIFDIAFANRLSFVKYYRFSSTNYGNDDLKKDYLEDVTDPVYVFAEPAITARLGFKFIKLQAQYGLTLNMGRSIRHSPDFSSLGVVINIK
ncbi:MAG: hypothetical protein K0S32_249 [Bacteroidetes bacterium]|jgi:hypothetical protein|nr:hypothetical protein [Bacteroidota bacterium]